MDIYDEQLMLAIDMEQELVDAARALALELLGIGSAGLNRPRRKRQIETNEAGAL